MARKRSRTGSYKYQTRESLNSAVDIGIAFWKYIESASTWTICEPSWGNTDSGVTKPQHRRLWTVKLTDTPETHEFVLVHYVNEDAVGSGKFGLQSKWYDVSKSDFDFATIFDTALNNPNVLSERPPMASSTYSPYMAGSSARSRSWTLSLYHLSYTDRVILVT